jgi:hypothetical protein
MRKRRRLEVALASFGFAISAGIWVYLDLTDYVGSRFVSKLSILCPACILGGYTFLDVNGHSVTGVFVFIFLSILNAAIYFGIAAVVGRFLWKSD